MTHSRELLLVGAAIRGHHLVFRINWVDFTHLLLGGPNFSEQQQKHTLMTRFCLGYGRFLRRVLAIVSRGQRVAFTASRYHLCERYLPHLASAIVRSSTLRYSTVIPQVILEAHVQRYSRKWIHSEYHLFRPHQPLFSV